MTPDSLTKRDLEYDGSRPSAASTEPTAMCVGDRQELVFVWEQGAGQRVLVRGHRSRPGRLHGVDRRCRAPVAMVANPAGIEQVPGARTFLYLADPESGVIHRYAVRRFSSG